MWSTIRLSRICNSGYFNWCYLKSVFLFLFLLKIIKWHVHLEHRRLTSFRRMRDRFFSSFQQFLFWSPMDISSSVDGTKITWTICNNSPEICKFHEFLKSTFQQVAFQFKKMIKQPYVLGFGFLVLNHSGTFNLNYLLCFRAIFLDIVFW